MKRLLVLSAVFFLLVLPEVVLGQSATEAVRSLKKLEARVQVGISYRDYAPALGDTKFEVNLFMEGLDAKKKVKLAESIARVMIHYQYAGSTWNFGFSGATGCGDGAIWIESDTAKKALKLYPKAKEPYTEGGAVLISCRGGWRRIGKLRIRDRWKVQEGFYKRPLTIWPVLISIPFTKERIQGRNQVLF